MDKAPPSAVAPSVIINNSDICRHGISGSVTTSVVGISSAVTIEDIDCVRIKLSRALFGMGMKVAGVSTLCQSPIIFDAMAMSNTWCPYYGKIADDAEQAWKDNPQLIPEGSLIRKQIELANKPSKKTSQKRCKNQMKQIKNLLTWVLLLLFSLSFSSKADNIMPCNSRVGLCDPIVVEEITNVDVVTETINDGTGVTTNHHLPPPRY